MKRVGPELKMPDVKVPEGVNDFYQDLRDRRLLPVIALVIVAIVAVPFLLGESREAEVPPSSTEALAKASSSGDNGKLVVVRSTPGLRDYKKRLKGKPTDPFKQRFTGPVTVNAQLGEGGGGGESSTTVTTTTSESTPSPSSPSPEPSPPPVSTPSPSPSPSPGPSSPPKHVENPGKGHLTFYAWTINVKITKQGGSASSSSADKAHDSKSEGSVRKEVLPQTALPGEKAPVVTYMGASRNKPGRALLLVSSNVKSIFGEASCANKTEDVCQLLEVEPGFPVTLTYGFKEVRYTVNVLKLELVPLGHS